MELIDPTMKRFKF